MLILTNAFSINMLSKSDSYHFDKINIEQAQDILAVREWTSAVGHADTANLFSSLLGQEVPCIRSNVNDPTTLLVGQYSGPRLQEGCTSLPEGATIQWWLVRRYRIEEEINQLINSDLSKLTYIRL